MPSDLEAWETKNGKIPDDVILLVFTNWGRYWPDKKKYLGTETDDFSLLHFPGGKIRKPRFRNIFFALVGGESWRRRGMFPGWDANHQFATVCCTAILPRNYSQCKKKLIIFTC